MKKNNLAIQVNPSAGDDSTLSVAYKKINNEGHVVGDLANGITPGITPEKKQRLAKKKTEKVYRQLVPVNIFNELPTIEEKIKPKIKGYQTAYLLQMISIIAWHIRKNKGTARLMMGYLKDQIPQGDKYLYNLLTLRIVKRTGHYTVGNKSFKYSFAPEYLSKYIEIPLLDKKFIRRLEQLQVIIEKENRESIWGHLKQRKFLKMLTLDARCWEFIQSVEEDNIVKYNNLKASANKIEQKIHTCRRDKTAERMHTNITNMPKELRDYLRVNGQPLVNIDIKNSQPYLSTVLLTHPEQVALFAYNDQLAELLKTIKIPKSRDIARYIELVTKGGIYEYLMDEFSKEGIILTRKETKKQVLRTLYAKNWKPKEPVNRRAREIFIDRFPNVHRVFSRIRGRGPMGKDGDKDSKFLNYKRFAILLQRIESHLVLDVIMKQIYKELPGVFAMTIHDSILTVNRPEVVSLIKDMMAAELENFVGYPPELEEEWLGRKN